MPRASFAAKDMYEPKFGFQEGYFEVVEASTKVFQYPPNKESGEQHAPFLAASLMLQRLDDQGRPVEGDEPTEQLLRIEADLKKMRPGSSKNRDDDNPDDLGDELDTQGNSIYCEEGVKVNLNTAFGTFTRSLEERGFKSEILGAGFLPDLVGLKAHGVTKKGEKRTIKGKDVEPNYFVVDKILVRPYEKATVAKTASKPTATSSSSTGKTKAADKPAATAQPVNEEADQNATEILIGLKDDLAGQTRDSKKFYAMAYSRLMKDKNRDKKLDKPVSDLLKNDEWLKAKAEDLDFTYDNGLFQFGGEASGEAAA